jgi:hypothetical protein
MTGFMSSARKPPPALENYTLMREFKETGRFWLPEATAERLWGRLHYLPGDSTNITLDGNISRLPVGPGNLRFTELHGELSTGEPVVLKDLWGDVETFGEDQHFRTNLHAQIFLYGLPAERATGHFKQVWVEFSHLAEWFERPLRVERQDAGLKNMLVIFEPDEFAVPTEFEGWPLKVTTFCERTIPIGASTKGVEFTYSYKLIIAPDDPQPLDWHLRAIAVLRSLFMLLLGNGVYTLEIKAFGSSNEMTSPVHVFPRVTVPLVVRLEDNQFYVRHETVRNDLGVLAREWFAKEEILRVIRGSLIDLLTVDGLTPEAVFTRIVQTMEHLHGVVSEEKGRYVAKRTWRRFCAWLDEVFPGKPGVDDSEELKELKTHREPLIGQIRGVNSLTFRSRLRSLFDRVPGRELMPLLDNPGNPDAYLDEFLRRVEATRNYLTHFSSKLKADAFDGKDLERAALQCWAVLLFNISFFLGVREEVAGEIAWAGRKSMFLVGPDAII